MQWLRKVKRRYVDPFVSTRHMKFEQADDAAENRHDVLCLPIINWDFRFQRPQQLMSRFGAAGHRVFYVRHQFRPFGRPWKITPKAKNVYEVSLRGPAIDLYSESLDEAGAERLFASINALRRDLSLGATAIVVQLPSWWALASKLHTTYGWPLVYDCMDDHPSFAGAGESMKRDEARLFEAAGVVAVSSTQLEERARAHAKNVIVVRNACDYEHFAATPTASNARPVVGYYGAIAEWFDVDLVAALAERRPDWDFVLVGSTYRADVSRLKGLKNVSLPGEQPYESIPRWLGTFDVAIIPFRRTPLTEATNPVKVYEMLAAGKPVVSVPIPEVAAIAPLVRLASDVDEFEREIEEFGLRRPSRRSESGSSAAAVQDERRAFARQHTWERRYEVLERATADTFPRASIAIVTYNNAELNRLCLETLFARTEWPNFEVIVVDNASQDGTVDLLREFEQKHANLTVIYNDQNLGFAPANNIALRRATGDYIVLLNNDTAVPRGWLSTLIRHLEERPSIGLIGPVSNAVGNEALIEVGYEDIQDMPLWAAKYVRAHDGETFPIHMLGMFCVVMRRSVFEKIGFLDERFAIGMFEDDDYARRIRDAGYEIVCARDAFVHHWQKSSFKLLGGEDVYAKIFEENRQRYREKWGEDAHAGLRWQPRRVWGALRRRVRRVFSRR